MYDDPTGTFLVRSNRTLHLFDLARRAYMRLPTRTTSAMDHDGVSLALTAVERWPSVGPDGGPFLIWLENPREYAVMDYWRQSSTIRAIYRIDSEPVTDPAPAPGDRPAPARYPSDSFTVSADLRVGTFGEWQVVDGATDVLLRRPGGTVGAHLDEQWPLSGGDLATVTLSLYSVDASRSKMLRLERPAGPAGTCTSRELRWIGVHVPTLQLPAPS